MLHFKTLLFTEEPAGQNLIAMILIVFYCRHVVHIIQ